MRSGLGPQFREVLGRCQTCPSQAVPPPQKRSAPRRRTSTRPRPPKGRRRGAAGGRNARATRFPAFGERLPEHRGPWPNTASQTGAAPPGFSAGGTSASPASARPRGRCAFLRARRRGPTRTKRHCSAQSSPVGPRRTPRRPPRRRRPPRAASTRAARRGGATAARPRPPTGAPRLPRRWPRCRCRCRWPPRRPPPRRGRRTAPASRRRPRPHRRSCATCFGGTLRRPRPASPRPAFRAPRRNARGTPHRPGRTRRRGASPPPSPELPQGFCASRPLRSPRALGCRPRRPPCSRNPRHPWNLATTSVTHPPAESAAAPRARRPRANCARRGPEADAPAEVARALLRRGSSSSQTLQSQQWPRCTAQSPRAPPCRPDPRGPRIVPGVSGTQKSPAWTWATPPPRP
mmetsp:Transcript_11461/g.38271  ORF Transcript_11461/g.38271 Transcript_11461/m.38271 type:complete len:404 (-) Transcript_11461:285-1496(-)